MSKFNQELSDQLLVLQENYKLSLPEKLEKIKGLHGVFVNQQDESSIKGLEKALHKLAGSAGTYGFDELSMLAKNAKQYCNEIQVGNSTPQSLTQLNSVILELINNDLDECLSTGVIYDGYDAIQNKIDIYTENLELADELKNHFNQCGYDYSHFTKLDEFIKETNNNPANIVIIDSDSLELLSHLENKINKDNINLTKIILHSTDSFSARLLAVRAGCDVFITKPIDINILDSKILENLKTEDFSPYRILIVNDQQEQIDYYKLILEQAKFDVRSIKNPGTILGALEQNNPDAILLDINMPVCNGMELAKIIRQYHTHFDVPIIFLSANEISDKISQVRTSGGDDYLVKPVSPGVLIDSLQARAKRYRAMKKIMNSDSLTGLLNHSNCKLILANEILRAKRYKRPLSIALIDIDYFKKVNDTFGHQAGDLVIKNLSTLLKIQLRRTDYIGRYGGEEFMVIMPETCIDNAKVAIEKIRAQFEKLVTPCEKNEIKCSLSAGIASLEQADDASTLIDYSDKALYKAKENGRNCVVLYTEQSFLK
jgi:diguanylate cyclase (GGDEF)-like protein